jgi:hypothetical protein
MKFFLLSLVQLHSYFPKSIIEFTVNLKSIRLYGSYAAEKHELKISVKVGGKKIGIKISKSLKKGPTGSRTQVAGFKVQSANHYTIEP